MDRGEGTTLSLKAKLKASEKLVAELTQENQEIKREVKLLAQELEELHDTFREDQVSEFRDIKRELEATTKNCRVLQFKLKKSERLNEQLVADKTALEKRINDLLETSKVSFDKQKMRDMENELYIAKEVSLKLHSEINDIKNEKCRLENALMEAHTGSPVPPSLPSTPTPNKDYEEVVRSLCDTMEREKDLQEQLKFAEEENRTIRKKLTNLEQENDILMAQIKRMANKQRSGGSCKDKGIGGRGGSGDDDSDELNVDEMKLQLELYEQEIAILRKKSDEIVQENDNLTQEVKYLQEKLVSQPLTKVEIPEIPPGSPPNVIYEHKIRILETEARELRKKLVDREKEVDNLRTELEVHRRKASKVMVRSRSLESEAAVDLKRQLQLVEQEASILRQKIITLEGENEKLNGENKRLQLRVSRRPPPGPVDQLQIENIELKTKISELEKRCDSFKGELVASKSSTNLATIIQDFKKPLKDIASAEKDVINGLRKQISIKEDEEVQLKRKIATLETEVSKLTMDNRKIKELLNYKKTPMRVIKESATRLELKEICRQMEDEISKLQVSLNAKEKMNENLEDELAETKKSLEMAQVDIRSKDNRLSSTLSQSEESSAQLKEELEKERETVKNLNEKLQLLSKNKSDVTFVNKVQSLEAEKKQLLKNICNIESELLKEKSKANESKDKLTSIQKEKKEAVDNWKRLEEEKKRLEKELVDTRSKLNQVQKELSGLSRQLEAKQDQIARSQEVVDQLKEQLDEERRSTSFTVSLKPKTTKETSESEGLIKKIAELESKNNNLERELERITRDTRNKELTVKKELEKQLDSLQEECKQAKEELTSIRSENTNLKTKVNQLNQQIEKLTTETKESADKHRKLLVSSKKEKDDLLSKLSDQESQLRMEQRRREKIEKENDLALKNKEENLLQARERIYRLEREIKRMEILSEQERRDNEIKLSNLNREVVKAKQEYDDLTSRYEVLEQEFVSMKSKLLNEKDNLMETLNSIKRSYEEKCAELKAFRDSMNSKQEDWLKEKLDYQEKLSELEARMRKGSDSDSERSKLRISLNDKEKQLDEFVKKEKEWTKENQRLKDQLAESGQDAKRGSTSLSNRPKISKEVQDMKNKMDHAETSHRGEIAALRAEYESRMKLMRDEITMLLSERDQLRARVYLGESSAHKDEMEDMRASMETLRSHLEQALLENRNLKIEHAAEKSSWQIQLAELKTRLNQADEQSLMEMSRGSARNYAKTRLELAWEKERQENQKLLTDTQRLVEDMKKRVISLEIAREKERTEAREQLKEMKVIMDKEQEDTQKRIGELQLDLIDLRDSHARMRSQNDRLKRERLALEKEREEYKLRMFTAISIENKVSDLCRSFDSIMKMLPAPESSNDIEEKSTTDSGSNQPETPTPVATGLQRRRSRKRPTEVNMEELRKALEDFKVKISELSKITVFREGDSFHRTISFRRAMSSSDMNPDLNPYSVRGLPSASVVRAPPRPKALAKKSLSLDQTMGANGSQERIWDSGDESLNSTPGSSMTNLRYPSAAIYLHRGGCSSISGYESESSYGPDSARWTRERSYGSDVSAPAVISSNTSRPKKSIFGLLKKTHSIESPPTNETGRENRDKKESSLRSKISKTLKKTLSRSSSSLTKESKDNVHDNEPVSGLRSLTSRTDGATALPYRRANSSTLGPSVKPPLAHDVSSTSRGLTRRENPSELNNIRSSLRSVNSLSRSTRV
ncbi:myosin-2-like [Tetranychus urticae]|uniref:myosin-2-like n=1 Tax=Tetranychus urticae TaxID=32264 RepID=UPI00077BD24C|nr:myosin-2-like [Tetranychus urticae]XP_025018478.1 myosin-2-like [Tetranychus urticae]XP_025018479.1 myosin-2-like [Tetranychus urticae]